MNKPVKEMTEECKELVTETIKEVLRNNIVGVEKLDVDTIKEYIKKMQEKYVEQGLFKNVEEPEFDYKVDKHDPTLVHIIPKNPAANWLVWYLNNVEENE